MTRDQDIAPTDGLLSKMSSRVALHDFAFGRFSARRKPGASRWPDFDLFWLHHGRVRVGFAAGGEELLQPGQGLLIYPDTEFCLHVVTPACKVSVHHFALDSQGEKLDLPLSLRRLLGKRRGYEAYRPRRKADLLAKLTDSVRWAACRQTAMVKELRVAQLAAILAQLTLGAGQGRPIDVAEAGFERLTDEMRRRLDTPMSLRDMAGLVGLSVSHFRARFRQLHRVSPGYYLLRMRISEATRLLGQTDLPIKVIARRVGYTLVNAFHRAFRAHIGMTPIQYRRRYSAR